MNNSNTGAINYDGSLFYYKIEKSENNKDILIINNKYIHSKYCPEKEFYNNIYKEKSLIIFFGIGLGYGLNNVLKNNPESYFIIFEPFKDIFDIFFYNYLDKNIYNNLKENILFLTEINSIKIYQFFENINFINEGRIYLISNINYKNLLPDIEFNIFKEIKKIFEQYIQNKLTEKNFIFLWTKNFLYNSSFFDKINILNITEKDDKKNNILVICCAGPNLIYDIEIIKKYREKITIFAVDTALKPLLLNNIYPDIIVSLDTQYYSLDDFLKFIPEESLIILDTLAYPQIKYLTNNCYFMLNNNIYLNSIIEYFFKFMNLDINKFDINGTVSDYCFKLGFFLGFNKIYFSGLDLSYPDFLTHSKFTPYYNKLFNEQYYFKNIETEMIKNISKRNLKFEKNRVFNKPIITDFVLNNYAQNFSLIARNINNKIYYSNYDGLYIENFNTIRLEELIQENETIRLNYNNILSNQQKISIDKTKLHNFYNYLLNELLQISKELNILLSNTDFNNKINNNKLIDWNNFIENLFIRFPFLKKFIIMTELILSKKNITSDEIIYFKHTGFVLLQSIYYLIRVLQKTIKLLNL